MKAYVIGGLGDAGRIITRQLQNFDINPIIIDSKLNNLDMIKEIADSSLIFIAVPPLQHYEYLKIFTAKQCKIFVEKPLVYSLHGDENELACFCNLNMEFFNINNKDVIEIGRYVQGSKPAYIKPRERAVILDLMPHLLSIFTIEQLNSFRVKDANIFFDNSFNDVFAVVDFNSFRAVVCYSNTNVIWVKYSNNKRNIISDQLPEKSWNYNIKRFLDGECNTNKAIIISKLIDDIYDKH